MGRRSLTKFASVPSLPSSQGLNLEATDNWIAADFLGIPAQTQTSAQEVCLAAVALQVKYSGIFDAKVTAQFSGSITAKTIRHKLITIPFAAPAARFTAGLTGNTTGVQAARDVLQDLPLGTGNWAQEVTADTNCTAASGILFNGVIANTGAANAATHYNRVVSTLTGLLTADAAGNEEIAYANTVSNTVGSPAKAPFVRGQIVVLAFLLFGTNGGDVVLYPSVSLSFSEKALG